MDVRASKLHILLVAQGVSTEFYMRHCVIGMLIGNRMEEVLRSYLRVAVSRSIENASFSPFLLDCGVNCVACWDLPHGGTWIAVDVT